jgi:hypothetical protein
MISDANYILDLKAKIAQLEEQNKFLKSPLYISEICDIIKREYSNLLNPPLFEFKTTKGQRSCSFELDINDIVCVTSDGKTKWIHFQVPQSSINGVKHVSDKLCFTGSLEEFCLEFDKPKIHLCQITRSVIVNIFYYYVDRKQLRLVDETSNMEECNNFQISKDFKSDFIRRKSGLKHMLSFQKIDFQGNYIYKDSIHDSLSY